MSGSGSESDSGGTSEDIICGNLEFTTNLSSPQEEEIERLEVGVVLPLVYQDGRVLVVSEDAGETVGSINWSRIDRLIECIQEGTTYAAQVLSIDGAQVRIRVRAVDD